ncbi:hypothetical protein [Streptosporangium carneum]|uniref:Uncharacterized protein n=1 Tax=Streptosporangium carneum TaxID=47481 RepID=A0A9W6I6K2_9ACTN|nr:hypothetical protein [Streptosporangium carneum]GLK11884.1 hypothetical protein GCM10017600_52920 [Streptosporangium carneum]
MIAFGRVPRPSRFPRSGRASGPLRAGVALLTAIGLVFASATPALAYPPVETVHTERVQAGPYSLTVGYSTWPLRALSSLDFTFTPDGGIDGKRGVLTLVGPDGSEERARLARHPRKREVWGLDTFAVPSEGNWVLRFTVDGPAGRGEGRTASIPTLPQPGPPLALSWAVGTVPLWALVALIVVAWRRTGPGRRDGLPAGSNARTEGVGT